MGLSKNYKKRYVVAGSLIESVIAITIITICLLIALKLYITVMDIGASKNNNRLKYSVDKLVTEMKLTQNYDAEIYDFKKYRIRKTVSNYENKNNLIKVSYSVQTKSDTLTYNYLVLKQSDEK